MTSKKFGNDIAGYRRMLSYATAEEAAADRDMQRSLLVTLDASKRSLSSDECGAWRLTGRRGHIYTWGPSGGWLIYCAPESIRKWTYLKKQLSFCRVTQDGDDEGCLRLFELPTPEQAVLIRKMIGLKQRKRHPGNISQLKFATSRRGGSASPVREEAEGGVMVHPEAFEEKNWPECPR